MDINTLRGISTIFVMIAFLGVCWWAFSPKRKKRFDDAANLPFADETKQGVSDKDLHSSTAEDSAGGKKSAERQD